MDATIWLVWGVVALVLVAACAATIWYQRQARSNILLIWAGYEEKERKQLRGKPPPRERMLEGVRVQASSLVREAESLRDACMQVLSSPESVFANCETVFNRFIDDHTDGKTDTTFSHQEIAQLKLSAHFLAMAADENGYSRVKDRLLKWHNNVFEWESISCRFFAEFYPREKIK